jgi:hypothetical protein
LEDSEGSAGQVPQLLAVFLFLYGDPASGFTC